MTHDSPGSESSRTDRVSPLMVSPAFGVMFWREFMMGTSVLTAVPSEPREMVPLEVLNAVLGQGLHK